MGPTSGRAGRAERTCGRPAVRCRASFWRSADFFRRAMVLATRRRDMPRHNAARFWSACGSPPLSDWAGERCPRCANRQRRAKIQAFWLESRVVTTSTGRSARTRNFEMTTVLCTPTYVAPPKRRRTAAFQNLAALHPDFLPREAAGLTPKLAKLQCEAELRFSARDETKFRTCAHKCVHSETQVLRGRVVRIRRRRQICWDPSRIQGAKGHARLPSAEFGNRPS